MNPSHIAGIYINIKTIHVIIIIKIRSQKSFLIEFKLEYHVIGTHKTFTDSTCNHSNSETTIKKYNYSNKLEHEFKRSCKTMEN
jgi:hypothetical protein